MATANPTGDAVTIATSQHLIEITREHRNVLWEDAECSFDGAASDLSSLTGKPSQHDLHVRARLALAMHLLDDLGWQQDDPRERFYITLPTPALRRWLQELDEYALDSLGDDAAALRDPVKEFRFYLEFGEETLEELVAEARRAADHHLEIHTVASTVLAMVGQA